MNYTGKITKILFNTDKAQTFIINKDTTLHHNGALPFTLCVGKFVKASSQTDIKGKMVDVDKIIMEDSSDFDLLTTVINGIGEKTAVGILSEHSIEEIEMRPERIIGQFLSSDNKSIYDGLVQYRDSLYVCSAHALKQQIPRLVKKTSSVKITKWLDIFYKEGGLTESSFETELFLSDQWLARFLMADSKYQIYQKICNLPKLREEYDKVIHYGIYQKTLKEMFTEYGENISEALAQNPYILTDRGVPFDICDALALNEFHVEKNDNMRVWHGLLAVIKKNEEEDGNTFLYMDDAVNRTLLLLDIADRDKVVTYIETNSNTYDSALHREGDRVYGRITYYTEKKIGRLLYEKATHTGNMITPDAERVINSSNLSDEQKNAVRHMLQNKISILTGGPGTGKTATLDMLCKAIDYQNATCLLAAPTGRAAKRIHDATGREATTVHRLLGLGMKGKRKNESLILKEDYIIIDESSMLDAHMAIHLLNSISTDTSLIFVGDVDQLPSVSLGSILGDMGDSGIIPVYKLTQVFRQNADSGIIDNAYKVHDGQPMIPTANGFLFKQISSVDEAIAPLKRTDKEFQVLCPTHDGDLGCKALNKIMQDIQNPKSPNKIDMIYNDTIFRVGDKIIQTKNDYVKEVYNGEIGYIKSMSESDGILICFPDNEPSLIHYSYSDLDEIQLAYAITIHKSQGSEFDNVALMIGECGNDFLSKELIYTAITRAKKGLYMCSKYPIETFSGLPSSGVRLTDLAGAIKECQRSTIEAENPFV